MTSMSSAGDEVAGLHFVLVPMMEQGHMIPMVDLARLLAERGVLVTLITTPFNLSRIKATVDRVGESRLPLRFVPLRFPCEEAGLPEGSESADLLPSPVLLKNFFAATEMLREPLLLHLRRNPPLPSCIVSDCCHPWTRHVARDLGVPRFEFYSICCFTLLCDHNLKHHRVYESVEDDATPVAVPGVPLRVEVTRPQTLEFFFGRHAKHARGDARDAELMSHGAVVNTFAALEPDYIQGYEAARGGKKRVWAIGPVSLWWNCKEHATDRASRGDEPAIDEERCLSWLDSMAPQSVLYVSFGTVTRTSLSQVVEIALGLEATKRPFMWAIRAAPDQQAEVDGWLAGSGGFEERTKGRGLVIRGWAPQLTILSHPSVGGFLTHCGWNSTLEAITAGVPMLTWPGFGDQFLNERFIVQVLRVGVAVGVKENCELSDEIIKREEVAEGVNRLMDSGGEAEERRRVARELAEMARKAMDAGGGSSHASLTLLIDEVITLHAKNNKSDKPSVTNVTDVT